MSVLPLPSLPDVVARLSHRPAAPFSLNLLYVLLRPFLPSPSSSPTPSATQPSNWDTIYDYYGAGTMAVGFSTESDPAAWAVILTKPLGEGLVKVHSGFSDPSPSSTSRRALFTGIMTYLKQMHPGSTVSFGGVPDGLQEVFDAFVEKPKGVPGRSYKVQMPLKDVLAQRKALDTGRFQADALTWEEIPSALEMFGSSYKPADFMKQRNFTSCIRDRSTPDKKPVSWCLVYEDLSIAALCTLPGYRGASLAHHTISNLAATLAAAFAHLPADIRLALPSTTAAEVGLDSNGNGEAWLVADWNMTDKGPTDGAFFFAKEGFEKLEEGVRWSRGRV